MNELHGVHIREGEQESADRRVGRPNAEMPDRQTAEAEEPDRGERGDDEHVCGERIDAGEAQRRVDDSEQKERVGVAERTALWKEDDRIAPGSGAREHVPPMLDQRQRKVTVLLVAERAVEAGEQPGTKHQHEACGEQRRGNPAVGMRGKLAHE